MIFLFVVSLGGRVDFFGRFVDMSGNASGLAIDATLSVDEISDL